jgi:hypothetical protein
LERNDAFKRRKESGNELFVLFVAAATTSSMPDILRHLLKSIKIY